MDKKSRRIFNGTLAITITYIVLLPVYVIIYKIYNDPSSFQSLAASWITLIIATTGFYLLIKRFDAQQIINNRTISKYNKDKIEQQLFQLLKLHNDHLKELRSGFHSIIRSGEVVRTVNLVDKMLTEFDAIVSSFTLLDNPVFEDIDWEKDAKNIDPFQSRLHSIGIKEEYDYLNERVRHIGSWSYTTVFTDVISKFPSYEILHNQEHSKIHIWAYQLLFLGANPSNMADLRKKIGSNHTYLAFESMVNNLSIPLHGYQNQLSPFFKIYHQAVIYTDNVSELPYREKYQYLKMFRGSMNTGELTLFFYNVISGFGKNWQRSHNNITIDLITKYNIVKNIPRGYSAFGYEPNKFFPDICYEGRNDSPSDKEAHFNKYDALDKKFFEAKKKTS